MIDNSLLLENLKNGDKSAEEELVINNMNLVRSIAGRFSGRGCDADDLLQIGSIGLLKAIKKFDAGFGVKFSTYAVPVIAGEIKRFLRDDGIIKISRSLKESAAKGKKCAQLLRNRLGREPTIEEISIESGIASEELVEAFDAVIPPETITPQNRDGKEEEIKITTGTDEENKLIDRLLVEDMLKRLSDRERKVIVLRYFRGKTQSEIAEIIGVSQVQISRIEKASVEKLRREFE